MTVSFTVSAIFPIAPDMLYAAWLDAETHSAMTGTHAEITDIEVTPFKAGDGYIEGVNLELEPGKRILQRWRTRDFSDQDQDSTLEILFAPEGEGTRMTIIHSNLPEDGMQYKQGWIDHYFIPMQAYFSK